MCVNKDNNFHLLFNSLEITYINFMYLRTASLTLLALIAFAGNSLLCRAALANTSIDPTSFTTIRLLSGAFVLWFFVAYETKNKSLTRKNEGSWTSALALFAYAACFSFAYRHLTAAAGALILFAAVQITMISVGLWRGEKLLKLQLLGFGVSFAGLIALLLPGLSAPPLTYAFIMLCAGISWGIYSLRGKHVTQPLNATAHNFIKTIPFTILLNIVLFHQLTIDVNGVLLALGSGIFASGFGYAIWYSVLPHLKSTYAASLQLSVPVLAALGGVIFLGELLSIRLLLTSIAILGGIILVIKK